MKKKYIYIKNSHRSMLLLLKKMIPKRHESREKMFSTIMVGYFVHYFYNIDIFKASIYVIKLSYIVVNNTHNEDPQETPHLI